MKPCKQLRAANDSGPRQATWIRHVVLHSTEGGTAKSVAEFFSRKATQASTHLVVDDSDCYRCVPDLVIPWGAPGVNRTGLHIEHCGYAAWDRDEWERHMPMLRTSADHAASWAWSYHIPRVLLSPQQVKAGVPGFLTHAVASAAFTPGGHHDPGAGFPIHTYMSLVRAAYDAIVTERSRR